MCEEHLSPKVSPLPPSVKARAVSTSNHVPLLLCWCSIHLQQPSHPHWWGIRRREPCEGRKVIFRFVCEEDLLPRGSQVLVIHTRIQTLAPLLWFLYSEHFQAQTTSTCFRLLSQTEKWKRGGKKRKKWRPWVPRAPWVFLGMQMAFWLSYHSKRKPTHGYFLRLEVSSALSQGRTCSFPPHGVCVFKDTSTWKTISQQNINWMWYPVTFS